MPLLSLNYGINSTRGVYIDAEDKITSITYRYPYSRDLFEHTYSVDQYYEEVTSYLMRQFKISRTDKCDIIATGFPTIPNIPNKFANAYLLDQLVKKIDNYHVVSVTDRSVYKQNSYISHSDVKNLQYGVKEKNYLLNLALYSNVIPEKPSEYNLLLANVWNIFRTMDEQKMDAKEQKALLKPTLFMGDIFDTNKIEFEKISYLYLLSFIIAPGFHYISLDKHSELIHLAHMRYYNDKYAKLIEEYKPKNLGTLLNSPGDTSCLLQNDTNNSQLIEVRSGRIVFLPLNENTSTRIVVKGKQIGSIEKTVKGGKLGIIIDTRPKNDIKNYSYNNLQIDINANLKGINEIYGRL